MIPLDVLLEEAPELCEPDHGYDADEFWGYDYGEDIDDDLDEDDE